MKKLLAAVIMLFMVSVSMAQKLKSADIIGVWVTPDKTIKIEMFK